MSKLLENIYRLAAMIKEETRSGANSAARVGGLFEEIAAELEQQDKEKLDKTGNGENVSVTFNEASTRTNVASGDKLSVLFGKVKRWFSDLKTVAFTGKASDLSQDTNNRLVTDTEKAGWYDKYTRAEVDTKDAGKADLVHTHSKAQITDFPATLPANGGNADTVDKLHATDFGRAYSGSYNFGDHNNDITTAAFINLLESLGAFNQPYWVARGSWDYGHNAIISDTGLGRIKLSGSIVEVFGVRSNYTLRITTPSTSSDNGENNRVFIYVYNGEAYLPWWFKLANTSDIPTSLPASDVPAWAKAPTKPTYTASEVGAVSSSLKNRMVENCDLFQTNGMFGFVGNPANGPGPAYLSMLVVKNIETGYQLAGGYDSEALYFRGIITEASFTPWKKIAFIDDIPNVSNYLPLSGGAMAGMLSTCMMPCTFIEGMKRAAIKYNDLTAITNTAYHSFLAMKAQDNHILNFGGIGNDIGFRGYLGGRAQNGYDYRLSCNTADGSWTLEKGRFYIDGSAPEHVIMFRHYGVNTGYIGFGSYPTKDLIILNFATNKYINIAEDGKLYYDHKEIATVDQITGDKGGIGNRDWNMILTPGSYVTSAADWGTNGPSGVYLYGILVVAKAGTAVTQTYCESSGGTIYYRIRYSDAGGFGVWITVAKKSEIPKTTANLPDSADKRYVTDTEKAKIANALEVICAGVVHASGQILRSVGSFRSSVTGSNRVAIDHDWGHDDDYIIMTMNSAGKTALIDINNNVTFTINFVSAADKVRFVMYKI